MTCIFRIFIIIVIKLSFIARLNTKQLAQKRIREESPVVINFEQVGYVLRFVLQSDNDADLQMKSGSLYPFSSSS